jgi:hypothetical protein
MNTNRLTIVSAIFEYSNEDAILSQLMALKQTNACIVLYASPECYNIISPFCTNNVLLMPPVDVSGLWIHKIYEKYKFHLRLPIHRNIEKDTETYLFYRHAKHDCIEHAIQSNPWKGTHFAWIDFDMMYRCKNMESVCNYFKWLNTCNWRENVLTMTGGWNVLTNESDVLNSPYWRFCGVLMGDSQSVLDFCKLYKEYLPLFLEKHERWVWEFNVWAWMEYICGDKWTAKWYHESPDIDEICMCSSDHYTKPIAPIEKIDYMDYKIPHYYACSSSYICHNGNHYLNTRFVNYWIASNGNYIFYDSTNTIENKNVLTQLNIETHSPEKHWEISENINMNHVLCERPLSTGLEDIRLFKYNDKIHYVATTIGYTTNGKARIIMGEYNIETQSIISGHIIEPPTNTFCEKNWIPIVRRNQNTETDELFFIYKWHPMQIGRIEKNDNDCHKLEIIEQVEINTLIFRRLRGSSPFIETDRGLLGVVHFSENHTPRHYYHMLVLLDKDTFHVIEYSNTFCFEKLGIEFCIGFTIQNDEKYIFWISRHDRDPCMIAIPKDSLVFTQYVS